MRQVAWMLLGAVLCLISPLVAETITQTVTGLSPCTIDANGSITCSSAVSSTPIETLVNTTNDGNVALLQFNKTRGVGGNINAGDALGEINFEGQVLGSLTNLAFIVPSFKQPASGSNNAGSFSFRMFDTTSGLNSNSVVFAGAGTHIGSTTTQHPTIATNNCGAGTATVSGSDVWGSAVMPAAATTCTIDFGAAWSAAPKCVASAKDAAAASVAVGAPTNSGGANGFGQLILTFTSVQTTLFWNCHESA